VPKLDLVGTRLGRSTRDQHVARVDRGRVGPNVGAGEYCRATQNGGGGNVDGLGTRLLGCGHT